MSGWWAVFALALVAGLKGFQPQLARWYRRRQTRRSLYRLSRAIHEQSRWEPRDQLDAPEDHYGL